MNEPRESRGVRVNSLPCPNPTCSNVFAVADLQKAGGVTCPRCGQHFNFRRPSAAPERIKKSSVPVAKPAAPISAPPKSAAPHAPAPKIVPAKVIPKAVPVKPVAAPFVTPAPIAAVPGVVGSPASSAGAQPPVSQPRAARQTSVKGPSIVKVRGMQGARSRHPLLKFIVVALVIGIFGGAGYVAFRTWGPLLQFDSSPGAGSSGPGYVYHIRNLRGADERALTIALDKEAWTFDKDQKNRMKANAVFKRTDLVADAWVAVAVQDFGFRKPREGELLNGAIDRLRNLFEDSLQINAKLEPTTISGLPAWRCTFKGTLNVVWWGECYLVAHHGFGYWVFIAAPTTEGVQHQFAEFEEQRAITFTTDRLGWTEQPPELETFASADSAFSVKTPEKIWRANDPKTEDENGVLYLSGHFQSMQAQPVELAIAKNATLVGISLEKKTDLREAFKDMVAYLEKKKKEESKDYQFAPFKDAGIEGELADVGTLPGCVGELRLLRGKDTMRYVLIAVFNEGQRTYGLRFECSWDNQEIWRKEFRDLLKTARPAK